MTKARSQAGIALPVALMVLLIASLLASAAVLAATQSNDLSNRDTGNKAALEAADAGLRTAAFRLNMVNPDDDKCVTTGAPPASGQPCTPTSDTLGNGAAVQTWTSPALTTGQTCAGLTVVGDVDQRCVTAIASVRGVSVRTQSRVAAFTAEPVFAVPGLLGTSGLTIENNTTINGTGGTNKVESIGQSSSLTASELGPSGTVQLQGSGSGNPGTVTSTTTYVTSPIDPGTSATNTAAGGTCGVANINSYIPTGTNCDYRITNGLTNPVTQPNDPSNNVTWNATSRQLTVQPKQGAKITFGGGIYNFCDFNSGNNSTITIPPGVKVQIFIDSPYRKLANGAPACPAGTTGTLNIANGTTIINYNNDPTALQFYVYGNPNQPGTNQVTWNNNGLTSYVSIFAPYSNVNLQNNGDFYGGVSAWTIDAGPNFKFHWDPRDGNLKGRPQGLYYRTSWKQCPSHPTSASDPQSGC